MVLERWFEQLMSAASLHSIWQDVVPPGPNDVPVPISRTLLHSTLHGLVLLVALRVLKWTWTKARSKPSNTTLLKPDATKADAENKNREHGGHAGHLRLELSTHWIFQSRMDSTAFRLSRGLPLCVRAQGYEACSISSISVG